MSLRRKAIVFFMTFFVVWFVFVVFYLTGQVQEGHDSIENYRFNWEMKRVEHGINDLINRHEALVLDWAKWDDTYKYVQFPNDIYLDGILESNHFNDQNMNYYAFFDEDNQLIHAEGYDLEMQRRKTVPEDLIRLLPNYVNQKGLFYIEGQPIIFITHEVTDNTGLEPAKGLLAFAYDLTDIVIEELATQIQEPITIDHVFLKGQVEGVEMDLDPHYADSFGYTHIPYENEDGHLQIALKLDHSVAHLGMKTVNEIVLIFGFAFMILVAVVLYGVNNIVKRIGLLNQELLRIHDYKHLDERIQIEGNDELGSVRDHINELFDELEDAHHQLIHHATYDILTGMFNRRMGIERLEKAIAGLDVAKENLTIAYIDVDDLKVVNDMYGHHVGDDYLIHVCTVLKSVVSSKEVIARLGGDEFLVIFKNQGAEDVQKIFHPIHDAMNMLRVDYNLPYEMSISVGIFEYKLGMTVDDFIEEADQKMYKEKVRHREQKR